MAKTVEPFANFAAQELLKNGPSKHGWARKNEPGRVKSALKLFEWPRRFMILCRGCLYVYKESNDSNFCNKYPLSTYSVCCAQDITKYHWVFKLIGADVQTVFFAVDSEVDMSNWIDAISMEKEKFCSFTSGEESDEDHQYWYIQEYPEYSEEETATHHHHLPSRPGPAQPLRPHSRTSPGLSSAAREFQWPPSLESREPKQRRSLPPPREYSKGLSLPPPTGLPKNTLRGAPSSGLPGRSLNDPIHKSPSVSHTPLRPSDNLPRSPIEVNRTTSSPLRPPPKTSAWGSSDTCLATPPQVTRNSLVQDLIDGIARVQERVAASSADGTSMASEPPHREKRAITRMDPEGQSIRGRHREATHHQNPLPSSAYLERLSRESASRLLRNKSLGTYMVRWSQTATEKALSVRDADEDGQPVVKHYKIFFSEGTGYTLGQRGNSYPSIVQLLQHHYENKLPNTNLKLMTPYQ